MRSNSALNVVMPWVLYGLMVLFAIWLYVLSDIFTMGHYTPIPRKIALSTVALLLPVASAYLRTKSAIVITVLFVILTWVPIIILWKMGRPDWVKYYP